MIEQLVKKDCKTGVHDNLFPVTVITAIKDLNTGDGLDTILKKSNHLYLQFIGNSKAATRKLVPETYRRRGLWITYTSCKGNIVTEVYKGDEFDDESWGNNSNWSPYIDNKAIADIVKSSITSWYKA